MSNEIVMNITGWVGGVAFAICGLPQVYQCWKTKAADGMSAGMLWLWLLGEICFVIYAYLLDSLPLFVNNLFTLAQVLLIIYFKYRNFIRGWYRRPWKFAPAAGLISLLRILVGSDVRASRPVADRPVCNDSSTTAVTWSLGWAPPPRASYEPTNWPPPEH